jgi:starch synthase
LTLRSHIKNARHAGVSGDLYHGMAYMGIPIALDLGRRDRVPVVYDARDIYLEARNLARSRGITRWVAARAERGWAARSARVITVNDAYADVMAERLRVKRPLVVMNCSYRYEPADPRERRFHDRFGLDPAQKVVLYHGGLFPHRGIEELFEAMVGMPDGISLVLMGYGVLEPDFRKRAEEAPWRGRVHMMNAVPPSELLDWVACADVAAMPIQASTLNHRLTTPNKLFEAMAAGVPAVVSDLPGMASIVTETGSGVLVDPTDPAAIRRAIETIVNLDDTEWLAWRRRCLAAAHDRYSWETQVGRLIEEYSGLTGRPW